MKILSGRTYPNGFSKSRLYEVYLSYRDFGCAPEAYAFDIEYTKLEEKEGRETCHWFRDSDGRLIVGGLRLARESIRLEIVPNGFREISKVARVFISYAKEDSDAATRVYTRLRELGIDVWFDMESLLPGEHWKAKIAEAIRSSDFVIALLSTRSVGKRGYVQREIRHALEVVDEMPDSKVFLIPARLDDCRPGHHALYELQWIDLFPTWDVGWQKIERVLQHRVA